MLDSKITALKILFLELKCHIISLSKKNHMINHFEEVNKIKTKNIINWNEYNANHKNLFNKINPTSETSKTKSNIPPWMEKTAMMLGMVGTTIGIFTFFVNLNKEEVPSIIIIINGNDVKEEVSSIAINGNNVIIKKKDLPDLKIKNNVVENIEQKVESKPLNIKENIVNPDIINIPSSRSKMDDSTIQAIIDNIDKNKENDITYSKKSSYNYREVSQESKNDLEKSTIITEESTNKTKIIIKPIESTLKPENVTVNKNIENTQKLSSTPTIIKKK